MSKAVEVLETAHAVMVGERENTHGSTLINHATIAKLWNIYLLAKKGMACNIKPEDVALMMVLLKVSRSANGEYNEDDYVDMAAYASIAADVALKDE